MKKPAPDPVEPSSSAYYEAFRARLKTFREKELGWSQAKMAGALGLSKANYAKYEDRSKFPLHKLEQLAGLMRISIDELVTGRREKTKPQPFRVVGK